MGALTEQLEEAAAAAVAELRAAVLATRAEAEKALPALEANCDALVRAPRLSPLTGSSSARNPMMRPWNTGMAAHPPPRPWQVGTLAARGCAVAAAVARWERRVLERRSAERRAAGRSLLALQHTVQRTLEEQAVEEPVERSGGAEAEAEAGQQQGE